MRLFIFIFVLPFITCIASKSPVCPRVKNDLFSSAGRNHRIHTASKGKWSKRTTGSPESVGTATEKAELHTQKLLAAAIKNAELLKVVDRTDFSIARTLYDKERVTLKTYKSQTRSPRMDAECCKWMQIGGLVTTSTDNRGIHLILRNAIPAHNEITPDQLEIAIRTALCGQVKEPDHIVTKDLVIDTFTNPQELYWRRSSTHIWIATPIYFAAQTPIDIAISEAIGKTPITSGYNTHTVRTMYKGIFQVTLKKYFKTTGSDIIDEECNKWREINLLVGITVGIIFDDKSQKFYGMILGNHVPEMKEADMHAAITEALSERTKKMQAILGETFSAKTFLTNAFANPQEFAWIHLQLWIATPIHFITKDPIDLAISQAEHEPFAKGTGFFISRTEYNGRKVTLKTYTTIGLPAHKIIKLPAIIEYCKKWRKINLLFDTAVDLAPYYTNTQYKRFYMILGNYVPDISKPAMDAAIAKAIVGPPEAHFANPHEFTWKRKGATGIATPIRFF